MRILIIEDEQDVTDSLIESISSMGVAVDAAISTALDEAMDAVVGVDHYDLIIADLKIPSTAGALDASTSYGRDVYATARKERPGTPIWVFSGYADDDFLDMIIDEAYQGDPFGTGQMEAMIRRFRKIKLHQLVQDLAEVGPHVESLNDIELSTGGTNIDLTDEESRLIRLVARRSDGTTARLREISEGLSSSRTLHLQVIDAHGAQVAETIVKIGLRPDLEDEAKRYETYVPMALRATYFAPVGAVVTDGAGRSIALAYTVAVAEPESLGQLLSEEEASAVNVVARLRTAEETWHDAGHAEQMTVDELCELLSAPPTTEVDLGLTEEKADQLSERIVQVNRCPQHGDLHIGNVLVGKKIDPVLIDYGRTGDCIAAYDPVTLEMCLAFHPEGRLIADGWPSADEAARFDDLDHYLATCPCPEFVQASRDWVHEVANGDREFWVAVLCFAVRQLRFDDTSDELAIAYARRAADLLLA